MRYMTAISTLALLGVMAGCTSAPMITGLPAVPVYASAETQPVGTANDDAADDPAIWHNAENPAGSLIVATDKKAGLYVYNLDGKALSFSAGGFLNNVDLLDMGTGGVIVAASNRNDPVNAAISLYRLDTATAQLQPLGSVTAGAGEAYGLCLWNNSGIIHAFSVLKHGGIEEYRIELGGTPTSVPVLTRAVATQPEGCVVDPRDGTFYVGEENVGIWRFASGSDDGELVAPIDNRQLVADVEGLALAPVGETGGWLVASSQGDNTYARFSLPGIEPAGRFRIAAGKFGATEETDGIALSGLNFGEIYPGGLFVAQDGVNAPDAQNFKLVSWSAIISALE